MNGDLFSSQCDNTIRKRQSEGVYQTINKKWHRINWDIYIPYADADVEIIAFKVKFPSQLMLTFNVYM